MGKRLYNILERLNDFLEEHGNDSSVAAITLEDGTEFDIDYRHRKSKASLTPGLSTLERVAGHTSYPGLPFGMPVRVIGIQAPAPVLSSEDIEQWPLRQKLEAVLTKTAEIAGITLPFYDSRGFDPIAAIARVLIDDPEARSALHYVLSLIGHPLNDVPEAKRATFEDIAAELGIVAETLTGETGGEDTPMPQTTNGAVYEATSTDTMTDVDVYNPDLTEDSLTVSDEDLSVDPAPDPQEEVEEDPVERLVPRGKFRKPSRY